MTSSPFPEAVTIFFDENPEFLVRILPYLDEGPIHPEATPNEVAFVYDDIVRGIIRGNIVEVPSFAPEDPKTFELQFDGIPVFLAIHGNQVFNRIQNYAVFDELLNQEVT